MKFNLKVIGTGSAFTKKQSHTSLLIEVNDKKYLFDCGFKVPQALHDMGISLEEIDGIIISHIHGDHTGGLEEVGFMGKYVLNKKFDLFIAEELLSPLWDNTLSGGMYELGNNEYGSLEMFFNVHSFKDLQSFKINKLEILPIRTVHVNKQKPSYSFFIDERVFFSADSLLDRELINQLYDDGCKTFFHDCQLFDSPHPVHASITELIDLPEEIKSKTFALHYGDNYENYENIFKENKITRANQGDIFQF
ncbi:ribonuclease Z [compost metagenome]